MIPSIQKEITKISKEFAKEFNDTIGSINGSGWLIADPLSGYLNAIGYENKLDQLPENEKHPQVLIMTFKSGAKFIPAGVDLKRIDQKAKNWMRLDGNPKPKVKPPYNCPGETNNCGYPNCSCQWRL